MSSRLEKAKDIHIKYEDVFIDDNPDLLIIAKIQGNGLSHQISLVDGVYLCTCDDFHYRSDFAKQDTHKQEFRCKHIIALDNHVKEVC